jgi:hypothetical protein
MTRILRRYLLPGPLQAQQRCCNPDGSRVAGCTDWMLDLEWLRFADTSISIQYTHVYIYIYSYLFNISTRITYTCHDMSMHSSSNMLKVGSTDPGSDACDGHSLQRLSGRSGDVIQNSSTISHQSDRKSELWHNLLDWHIYIYMYIYIYHQLYIYIINYITFYLYMYPPILESWYSTTSKERTWLGNGDGRLTQDIFINQATSDSHWKWSMFETQRTRIVCPFLVPSGNLT